ncbi:MAG: flavodoxin [Acutalibacteraceae bacterium]
MKKMTAIIMSLILIFGLAACGNTAEKENLTNDSSAQSTKEASDALTENTSAVENSTAPAASEDVTAPASGKTLVVYYSASENTESAENYIAEATNADIFELKPTDPYTDADLNWTDENSRVVREHNDPSQRVIPLEADTVENWIEYDTVFISYPIWWGIAAWPVDGFIKANDFTGKTVILLSVSLKNASAH